MRKKIIASILTVVWCFAGCVVTSVYPFYTAKDLVEFPELVGDWKSTDTTEKEVWTFSATEKARYILSINNESKEQHDTHVFKLGAQRFLDFVPHKSEEIIPPHYIAKLDLTNQVLSVVTMDYEWLAKLLEKDPKAVRHVKVPANADEFRVVLTADTAELQAFLLKHVATEGAWPSVQTRAKIIPPTDSKPKP